MYTIMLYCVGLEGGMSLLAHQIMATTIMSLLYLLTWSCSVGYTCFDFLVSQRGTWVAAGSLHKHTIPMTCHLFW